MDAQVRRVGALREVGEGGDQFVGGGRRLPAHGAQDQIVDAEVQQDVGDAGDESGVGIETRAAGFADLARGDPDSRDSASLICS
ncbi:hypothetical protein BOX37_28800 [Nocardia mangyaensis]|uniref:Uncharacterized protein n=1 Tax=Nocardia mangyaensis TaxID=2213200 RepID=A0A1J0VZ37_9NOCA|nr:hypothetical protein [Nocardia mangyaensis]APE37270.1 hypothetical protein BOX37_28800 [Nocardia mangyaensis]